MRRKLLFLLVLAALVFVCLKPVYSQYDSYFDQANTMFMSGNMDRAIKLYHLEIQQHPGNAQAYLGLGMAYKESGKYQESYNSTMQAIKLKTDYYQAYYNLGLILEKLNKNKEAIDAYEKFLDEVPGSEKFSDAKQRIAKIKALISGKK